MEIADLKKEITAVKKETRKLIASARKDKNTGFKILESLHNHISMQDSDTIDEAVYHFEDSCNLTEIACDRLIGVLERAQAFAQEYASHVRYFQREVKREQVMIASLSRKVVALEAKLAKK